jgi:hypothetical protein
MGICESLIDENSILGKEIMSESISRYLADDHRRLEGLLQRATSDPSRIEPDAYWEFRGGLLRHISMEEKILLPAAQRTRGGEALPLAAKLRLDHGALASLLVMTPTDKIIDAIRTILAAHNPREEGANGIYEQCEQLAGNEIGEILARLQSAPPVAMAAYVDSPFALESARGALKRAGYNLDI